MTKLFKIIDPHIHLFNLEQGEYLWLKSENPPFWHNKASIAKSFIEKDLTLKPEFELTGFVHIEAGFNNIEPWREIAYLEQACKLPFRSIAFIDLLLNEHAFKQHLQTLLRYKSVVGCRYILDDQAIQILSAKQVLVNLNLLAEHNLLFEVQMPLFDLQAVSALLNVLSAQPKLKVIINHAGSPPKNNKNRPQLTTHWREGIKQLAAFSQCAIKCSGWEMNDNNYVMEDVLNTVSECLTAFGDERVMLASNFPLCLFSKSYQHYWQDQQALLCELNLTAHQQQQLCFKNAQQHYCLTC